MGQVIYKKMSLFDAPQPAMVVHACNAQGVWGRGIAAEFKQRFPQAFRMYQVECNAYKHDRTKIVGTCIPTWEGAFDIGCLITSLDYGKNTDPMFTILFNTALALESFAKEIDWNSPPPAIYSNKFNSGLFNVPWEYTEMLLNGFVEKYKIDWIVCDPNLEEIKDGNG